MRDVDLNLLYTLHTFVECGSLSETARALARSEPAISARLHRLEDELGVTIFERVGRRLALTPAGREVHHEASRVVEQARRIVDIGHASGQEPRGRFRIGTLGTVGMYRLADPVSKLVARHPHVAVEMFQGLSTDLAARLIAGEIDFVASIGEPPDDDRVVVELVREVCPVVVTRREDYAVPIEFDAARLREHPLLEWALADDLFFGRISRFLDEHGLSESVRVRVPHIATLKALVHAGAGVVILPDYTIVEEGLVAHPMPSFQVTQPMWFCWREAMSNNATLIAFRELLQTHG